MIISNFLRGTAKCKIDAPNPPGIINALKDVFPILKLEKTGDFTYELTTYLVYADQLCAQAAQDGAKTEIILRKGVPYFFSKYKKRAGIFLGLAFFVTAVYVSSLFVWEISIEGNERVSDEDIKAKLALLGFREGIIKSRVDLEKLHNDYLVSDGRISWIAVNFDGTVAHVEVKETALLPEKPQIGRKANIMALRDGRIVRIDAVDGQPAVKVGDVVSKGQLLVSAFIETRHSGAYFRGARGSVWAKTERKYTITVPLEYSDRLYTGQTYKHYSFKMLGKTFNVPRFSKERKNCICESETKKLVLFGAVTLPIDIKTEKYREYELISKERTKKQALEEAEKKLSERMEKDLKNTPVESCVKTHTVTDTSLTLQCRAECIENIGGFLDFELN